jgi:hypothetical protein
MVVVLFLLTVYAAVPSVNYTNCGNNQRFQALTFDGVVVNKYLDRSQHSTPIVEIENFEGRVDSVYLFGDHLGLYDRIQITDTLKKESGSNEVLTKRKAALARPYLPIISRDTPLFLTISVGIEIMVCVGPDLNRRGVVEGFSGLLEAIDFRLDR